MKRTPLASGAKHLVFSHGNGFPGGSYQLLLDAWQRAGWTVHAVDRFGHDARFPVSSNWPHLRDELIEQIEQQAQLAQAKIMLVGHSLGGLLSLMAACKRPDLVQGLVMLDSPVVTGWRAHSLHMAKVTRLLPRVSPAKVAIQRRHEWPDRDAVLEHFKAKRVFARWDPRALAAYVEAGFEEREGKTVLRFRRDIEARIYNTLPHHLAQMLRRHPLQCPCAFVGGTKSVELRQGGTAAARALAHQHFVWFEGTHLYPFERPEDTAALVLDLMEIQQREESARAPNSAHT
jgi:pimeloyl-ACP methyl ester carboxylesterase